MLASVGVSLCFPAFHCLSTPSLSLKLNCAVFRVFEKWLEKSNLTKRGMGSMGEGLPVLGRGNGFSGDCGRSDGDSAKGAETTADRVNPITGQARTICTPERSCVSGVIERFVRQQQQGKSQIRTRPRGLTFLFSHTLGRRVPLGLSFKT